MKKIRKLLTLIESQGFYPDTKLVSSSPTPEIIIGKKKVLSFCSLNYLGLSTFPKIIQASIEAIQKYGTGSGGSRLLSGNLEIHRELEKEVANFKETEDAITFPTGYMANLGAISTIMDLPYISDVTPSFKKEEGIILCDVLNHASIIDGCRLSRAQIVFYKHIDMQDLENKLSKFKHKRKIIITDSVFSMDGDIASLPELVELAKKYNALVMVDEAHATGILGRYGRGIYEYFGLKPKETDIIMGTFSKALGGLGGYIAGNKELIRFLRVASRPYIFSVAMPPGVAGGLIAAIKEIKNNPKLREKLWNNTIHLMEGLKKLGFNTLNSQTPIIPVLVGSEEKAIKVTKILFEKGFFAPCVRWPAVAKNQARIRLTVMALHTRKQINSLLEEFGKIGKELGLI